MMNTHRSKREQASFTKFFAQELRPILKEMEKVRRKRILLYGIVAVIMLFLSMFLFQPYYDAVIAAFFLLLAVNIVWLLRSMDQGLFLPHKMRSRLCRQVVPKCVEYALPGLDCRPVQHIRSTLFLESGLFTSKFNLYTGRNLCIGSGQGYDMRFSWVRARYIPGKTDDMANVHYRRSKLIFKGWYFVVTFPRNLSGWTLVLPDTAEAKLGWFGRSLQELDLPKSLKLPLLEDPDFEKRFKIISTGQLEARHILTPAFMRCAVNVESRLKGRMCMSFHHSRMFIALPAMNDFFDDMLRTELIRPEPLRELFHAIRGINEMAACVAANTTVWKENTGQTAIPIDLANV